MNDDCTIEYNEASTNGGGVYLINNVTFTMDGGAIKNNTASTNGGGIYVSGGTFTMNSGTINENEATNGGGVYVNEGTFTMNSGTINENEATDGAGVYVFNNTFIMNDGAIENNKASANGGGVYLNNMHSSVYGTFTMNSGTVESNTATTGSRIYLAGEYSTFKLYISSELTSTIKGALYTNDAHNFFNMTVHKDGNVTIDGGTATSKNVDDIAYFTGTTWIFEYPSIDFSSIITQPITGLALQTITTVTDGFNNTHNVMVEWSPNDTIAQANTIYTATVTFTDSTLENHQVINTCAGVKVDGKVVTFVFQSTEKYTSNLVSILDAKYYSGQLWDTQRSPAYPKTSLNFRLWSLKSPYDHYFNTFDMSSGEYVKFELVSNTDGVMTLSSLNDTSLTNAFNMYSNSSASDDGVLVREVLYNADGTEKQVLSDYGLIWALSDEGFLYTAFSGYLKYSGGIGTYVTTDARTSNDTIVYTPNSNDPFSQTDITDGKDVLADSNGDTSTPSNTTFDLYGKVVSTDGETAVENAIVTITYDNFTYTTNTDSNGYFIISNLEFNELVFEATVQTLVGEVNIYSNTLADKSDPIVLKYDSKTAGKSDVLELYTVTIDLGSDDGSKTAVSTPSGTVEVIPGESLNIIFGNEIEGYALNVEGADSVSDYMYTVTPTENKTIKATWSETTVTNLDLTSYVTAPIKNANPNVTDIDNDQYTGVISWNTSDSNFSGSTIYTATLTLTAKDGYTFTGIKENSFVYTGATSVNNSSDSGVITIEFPMTADKIISSIEITTNPTKVEYEYGEILDLTSMVVNANYDNETSSNITDYTVSHETFTNIGTVTVTVTKEGKTTSFEVIVNPKELTIIDAKATNREYNGTTSVEVTGNTLEGIYGVEDVSIAYTTGTSESVNVGTHLVTGINFVLSGSDKDNYILTQPTGLTVIISKATLSASDFTVTTPSNLIYDTTEKSATITNTNIVGGGIITLTYTSQIYNSTTPPTEVGIYEISVSVVGDSNYNDVSNLTDNWRFEIVKASHLNITATSSTKYGNSGSVDLSSWYNLDGANLSLGTVTDNNSILSGSISLSNPNLNFEFKNDDNLIGKTATALITVSSLNYADFTITVTFEVLDKLSTNAKVYDFTKTYDGNAVTIDSLTKSADVEGSWSIISNVTDVLESGLYTVTFIPTNTDDYATANVQIQITINPKILVDSDFTSIDTDDKIYTGSAIEPIVTSSTDYTISYSNNINVTTTAKITITGIGNYSGVIEKEFSIIPKEITISDDLDVVREYDGTTKVEFSGALNGVVGNDDVSYTATGTSVSADVGEHFIIDINFVLIGDGANNYKITSQSTDAITVDITQASISDVTLSGIDNSYTETGSEIIPIIVVTDKNGNVLTEGDDYTTEITNNISVGTATIIITGTGSGNYDIEEKEYTFSIEKAQSNSSNSSSSSGTLITTYYVSVEHTENGEIGISPTNPSKDQIVTITITPNDGFELSSLAVVDALGNNIELSKLEDGIYTYVQSSSEVTITTEFTEINDFVFTFTDVFESNYYYDAVKWAVQDGITYGKTETLFSPDDINTRAEIVTFLWRASGSPIVDCENPFKDVLEGTYYYNAVLWAVENGITLGTSEITFSPFDTCDRLQIVMFLYRYAGEPEVTSTNQFEDVYITDYYYNAVCWAFEEKITLGTSDNTFSPKIKVSRAQTVTFLYRLVKATSHN